MDNKKKILRRKAVDLTTDQADQLRLLAAFEGTTSKNLMERIIGDYLSENIGKINSGKK